jgi:para-nitrobenzyl esterase
MRGKCAAIFAILIIFQQTIAAAEPASRTVTIDAGTIEGAVMGDILSFKGIPYARPPKGSLRWRPPQSAERWANVRPAKDFGHGCPQLDINSGEFVGDEDCLYLNVWRPADKAPGEPLPVLFWIHGGGYVIGNSSLDFYDGSELARQGLVVVSINYRLGRLGFFAHPALIAAKEDPPAYSGNFGYMDQIQALKWVKTNIGQFGGNPRQVTIAGESAGGASVLHLLTSPKTTDLFQRVIVMSGGGRGAMFGRTMTGGTPFQPTADLIDAGFATICNIDNSAPDVLANLRRLPTRTLVAGVAPNMVAETLRVAPLYAGTPMIDGQIVVDEPEKILARGEAAKVPIIIGTTDLEGPLYFPPRTEKKFYPWSYVGTDPLRLGVAFLVYGLNPQIAAINIGTDMTMHEASRFAARMIATKHDNPAWLYRFSYVLEGLRPFVKESFHAEDIPFLFKTLDTIKEKYPNVVPTLKDRQMALAYSAYFANFAKRGDPNGESLPQWPKLAVSNPPRFQLMNFTLNQGPKFADDPLEKRIELVEHAAHLAGSP